MEVAPEEYHVVCVIGRGAEETEVKHGEKLGERRHESCLLTVEHCRGKEGLDSRLLCSRGRILDLWVEVISVQYKEN